MPLLGWVLSFSHGYKSMHSKSMNLKGQCHGIFCFRFFSWIIFPQAPENNIRVVSNFFKDWRRHSQVKVHHRLQSQFLHLCFPWAIYCIYSSDRSAYSFAGKKGGPNVGIQCIHRAHKHTVWKLGLRPRNSFSGNKQIQISLQCRHRAFTQNGDRGQTVKMATWGGGGGNRGSKRGAHGAGSGRGGRRRHWKRPYV